MAEKMRQIGKFFVILSLFCMTAWADDVPGVRINKKQVRRSIHQIISNKDFGIYTTNRVLIRDFSSTSTNTREYRERRSFRLPAVIVFIMRIFLYTAIGVIVGLIIFFIVRSIRTGKKVKEEKEREEGVLKGSEKHLMKFQLPDNIPETVQELWLKGEKIQALSLLYRGALSHLAGKYELILMDHYTEGDCLRMTRTRIDKSHFEYFRRITWLWRDAAYADILPEDGIIGRIIGEWQENFSV